MAKSVVRVHFMDDSCRAFAVEEHTTSAQLKAQVVERIELKEELNFAIFEKREGWERCLEGEEKPSELIATWTSDPNKKSATGKESISEAEFAFIFKKKTFLRDDEKELKDPVAKHLVYIEALHNVIESEYPCTVEDAIRLAGLQVQIVYGDHKAANHVVGFLTQNLKQFVPKDVFGQKKSSEWESAILKQHATHTGKSPEDAKSDYIEIVKQWSFYGTTFFPACKNVSSKKLPQKVVIGVNADGIVLVKPKEKEVISSHPFTEIVSWASSSTTFAFEFGTQAESQKYTFETKQGSIIASTIQMYVDILVQMLKSGEDDEED